jgi:adenine-specific DNA-methyltransferase
MKGRKHDAMPDLLQQAVARQYRYIQAKSLADRKRLGQVFTPPEIACFMASLLAPLPRCCRLLDPGAGAGVLSVAVCEHVLRHGVRCDLEIHAVETEAALASILRDNLEQCRLELARAGRRLRFIVHQEDFVGAAAPHWGVQCSLFDGQPLPGGFDAVIANPPYFKVRKDSDHARMMREIVHGQPNAYTFFLALAARLLKAGGQLVAITPRSFCNGPYFRGFRRWFFGRMALDHIHLFESRTETFKDSEVLQESVITRTHRLGKPSPEVRISASFGRKIPEKVHSLQLSAEEVLDDSRGECLIKVPVSDDDCSVMRAIESLPLRFAQTGLRISTGPVVTFRAREFLVRHPGQRPAVPLLMPHNISPFRTLWPIAYRDHPAYIIDCEAARARKLLVPARNYVVLKRFSAKEEKRRLTAGCLLRDEQPSERIGLENHLNYIWHADRDLTEDEVFGIAGLFNSLLYDRYFRILSGNTQVNATEIRNLHFPPLDVARSIGAEVRSLPTRSPSRIEQIVASALRVRDESMELLAETAP